MQDSLSTQVVVQGGSAGGHTEWFCRWSYWVVLQVVILGGSPGGHTGWFFRWLYWVTGLISRRLTYIYYGGLDAG